MLKQSIVLIAGWEKMPNLPCECMNGYNITSRSRIRKIVPYRGFSTKSLGLPQWVDFTQLTEVSNFLHMITTKKTCFSKAILVMGPSVPEL